MDKICKIKKILLALLFIAIGMWVLRNYALGFIRIEEVGGEDDSINTVITFKNKSNLEKFLKGLYDVETEIGRRKARYVNVKQIYFYNFLVFEFADLFHKSLSKPCVGSRPDLIRKVCRILAQLTIGIPETMPGAGRNVMIFNYGQIEANFARNVLRRFTKVKETIEKGENGFPVKITFGPEIIFT